MGLTNIQEGMRTAGILLREGASKGPIPTVELLSLGAKTQTRHPSDLLPYLAKFRPLFQSLPTDVQEMELRVLKIPLNDIDSVTKTVVQVRGPIWHLRLQKGIVNQFVDWDRRFTRRR